MEARGATTELTVVVADRRHVAVRSSRLSQAVERLSVRYRRTSLYVRVVAINAAIFAGATLVLAVTPATVAHPIEVEEAIVLVVGVLAVAVANALVLRISFGALSSLVARMRTVDLLRPRERLSEVGGPEMRSLVAGFNQMLARLEEERRQSSQRTIAALIRSAHVQEGTTIVERCSPAYYQLTSRRNGRMVSASSLGWSW